MTRGFSLIELIVCISLVGLLLIGVLALIPTGTRSLAKSQQVEAATMYAAQVVEEAEYDARVGTLTPGPLPSPVKVTLQTTDYQVNRNVTVLDAADTPPRLYQIDVAVSWNDQPVPVRLSTRLFLGQ